MQTDPLRQNLDDPSIFEPANLQSLRDTITQHVNIYSFSPLRSFRRIIVTFYDITSATTIRQQLDGSVVMDQRVRIYFGAHTALSPTRQHLAAPKVDKLFFISPPPSPPHGWAVRNEGAPNKTVHAEDLAEALARLHARCPGDEEQMDSFPTMADAAPVAQTTLSRAGSQTGRARGSSITVVYTPVQNGGSHPSLPAISVEDTEFVESPMEDVAMEDAMQPDFTERRTPRPPVELMEH